MHFLALKRSDGQRVMINPRYVTMIAPPHERDSGPCCKATVWLADGNFVDTMWSADDVAALMREYGAESTETP